MLKKIEPPDDFQARAFKDRVRERLVGWMMFGESQLSVFWLQRVSGYTLVFSIRLTSTWPGF